MAANTSVNQSLGQVSMASESEFLLIMFTVVESANCIIGCFGVLTNVISCFVFYRQGLRDRMHLCLFSLSIVDILYLVCSIFFSAVSILGKYEPYGLAQELYLKSMAYGVGINFALRTTVGLYIVVIAVDRYVCVAFPLLASSILNTRNMAIILVFLAAFPQLGFAYQPFKYDIIQKIAFGIPQWVLVPSKEYLANKLIVDFIVYTFFSACVSLFTFVVVLLATIITVLQLTTAVAWRREKSSASLKQNSQQMALTKMLVLASCVYIVSMAPMVFITIARLIVEEFSSYGTYSRLYMICNTAASGLPVINSSVNFFIYYCRSSRYKDELRVLFRCSK